MNVGDRGNQIWASPGHQARHGSVQLTTMSSVFAPSSPVHVLPRPMFRMPRGGNLSTTQRIDDTTTPYTSRVIQWKPSWQCGSLILCHLSAPFSCSLPTRKAARQPCNVMEPRVLMAPGVRVCAVCVLRWLRRGRSHVFYRLYVAVCLSFLLSNPR